MQKGVSAKKAAKFIAAYEKLCEEHKLMVIMKENGGYYSFMLASIEEQEVVLQQALEELRLNVVFYFDPRE